MEIVLYPPEESWEGLCKRPLLDVPAIDKSVREILSRCKAWR